MVVATPIVIPPSRVVVMILARRAVAVMGAVMISVRTTAIPMLGTFAAIIVMTVIAGLRLRRKSSE